MARIVTIEYMGIISDKDMRPLVNAIPQVTQPYVSSQKVTVLESYRHVKRTHPNPSLGILEPSKNLYNRFL